MPRLEDEDCEQTRHGQRSAFRRALLSAQHRRDEQEVHTRNQEVFRRKPREAIFLNDACPVAAMEETFVSPMHASGTFFPPTPYPPPDWYHPSNMHTFLASSDPHLRHYHPQQQRANTTTSPHLRNRYTSRSERSLLSAPPPPPPMFAEPPQPPTYPTPNFSGPYATHQGELSRAHYSSPSAVPLSSPEGMETYSYSPAQTLHQQRYGSLASPYASFGSDRAVHPYDQTPSPRDAMAASQHQWQPEYHREQSTHQQQEQQQEQQHQQQHQQKPQENPPETIYTTTSSELIYDLREEDILCGRGAPTNWHPGNQYFRQLVNKYQSTYLASRRSDKPEIAMQLVESVRSRGGRFLKRTKMPGLGPSGHFCWKDIGPQRSYEKACQALRENAPEIRRRSVAQELAAVSSDSHSQSDEKKNGPLS